MHPLFISRQINLWCSFPRGRPLLCGLYLDMMKYNGDQLARCTQSILYNYIRFLFRALHRPFLMRKRLGFNFKFLIGELRNFSGHICGCWKPQPRWGLIEIVDVRRYNSRVESHMPEMLRMLCHVHVVLVSSLWMSFVTALSEDMYDTLCFIAE